MQTIFRLALLGALVVLWSVSRAQDSTAAPLASLTAQAPTSDLFPNFSPKSPTAAALGRYGEYPVSMYSGLATIEIPLCEFKVGALTVPIKLTYHSSGNKINDLASWVGLGWSLQTGGLITRSVQGRPDELSNGVLTQTIVPPAYSVSCPTSAGLDASMNLADNIKDGQRDLFSYRTPSGSNTFILTPEAPGFVGLTPDPVSLSASSGLSSFTLTDQSGTRFHFADGEATSTNQNTPYGFNSFTSAWYLSEIVSLNTSEHATYTYTTVSGLPMAPEIVYSTVVLGNLQETNISNAVTTCIPTTSVSNLGVHVDARFPTQIQFPGGKISFVLEKTTRSDGGIVLDYIDLLSYDINTSQYVLTKRFDFQYSYKTRTDGSSVTFLDGVNLVQADAATVIGSYSLTYNSTPLPAAAGNAKDYWGYYNGNAGSTLIPIIQGGYGIDCKSPSTGVTMVPIGNANRAPNESLMKAWVIQSIQYPTGGSTQFDFETNKYGANQLAGGLRIKQIRSYTSANQLATTKTYKYGTAESGLGTYRSMVNTNPNAPTSVLSLRKYDSNSGAPNFTYKAYTFSSSPTYPLSPDEGSPVTYSTVAEYTEDGNGNSTGKTVYEFRDQASDAFLQVGGGKGFLTSRSWDRGQLIREIVTDVAGNLRSKTENTYASYGTSNSASFAGVLVNRSLKQIGTTQTGGDCSTWVVDQYTPGQTYYFVSGITKIVSSSVSTYADDNSGKYTLKITETDYYPNFYLPKETRLKAEGGITLGTQLIYPQNFNSIPETATSPELLGIRALKLRNAYLPVETVNYRKEKGATTLDYKTGKLTSFTAVTLNGLTTALPYQTYLLEPTTSSFQSSDQRYNSSTSTSTYPIDPQFVLRVTMNSYDANGNLNGYTVTKGSSTTFAYNSYTPSGGVLFSTLARQTLNAGQSTAQTTSFYYARPLLGPSSTTDPKGVSTYYVYDSFGRLSTVKDKDNNVLKQYSYHYATAAP
ncbi:RHS repeat domain-containing protein [Spirosoma litoris]